MNEPSDSSANERLVTTTFCGLRVKCRDNGCMYTPQAGMLAAAIASIHERRTTTGGVNVVMGFRPPADALLRQGVPGAPGSVLQLQNWHHEAAAWEAVPSVESLQRLRHA